MSKKKRNPPLREAVDRTYNAGSAAAGGCLLTILTLGLIGRSKDRGRR